MHEKNAPVTVVGDNPRAAALRTTVERKGFPVTDEEDRARLVVLCAEDHDELARLLDRPLAGRQVVNFTSGTSDQARETAARVSALGGQYLDGALMAHPEHVGNPDTVLVYSGDVEVFEDNEALLRAWGGATYLGADAGTASLYDLAMLAFAWATHLGYLHTAALLRNAGVAARTVTPLLTGWLRSTVADVVEEYAEQIDDRAYPGEQEWLELDAPLMENLVRASEEHGVDPALPRLVASLTARGVEAGRGGQSFASLVEVIAPQGPHVAAPRGPHVTAPQGLGVTAPQGPRSR